MSGGPPHHPHSRQNPAANAAAAAAAWNHHLQVPNFFPRQPQHAHMSNEHPIIHQPTWHTPSTEPVKSHTHLYNLEQMLTDRSYPPPRHVPGVDLSLTRNGSQNGDVPITPISLSVRDTNKINSLPPGALEIQAVELTKCPSPVQKSLSPGLKSLSPGLKSVSPGLRAATPDVQQQGSPKNIKRPSKRVDSILEKLNQAPEKTVCVEHNTEKEPNPTSDVEKPTQSVIVQPASSSHDENSNSSSILNVPTPTNARDDEVVSPYSNEDSLDNSKSRRKRKPSKTVRVSKDEEKIETGPLIVLEKDCKIEPIDVPDEEEIPMEAIAQLDVKPTERRRSSSEPPVSPTVACIARRKTSSESETIANIAAMVQQSLVQKSEERKEEEIRPVSVSVIKTKENLVVEKPEEQNVTVQTSTPCTIVTPAQRKVTTNQQPLESCRATLLDDTVVTPAQKKVTTNPQFVEVENKLEEMFAGIEDSSDPLKTDDQQPLEACRATLLDDTEPSTSQMQDVTSTSNDFLSTSSKKTQKRGKRKSSRGSSRRSSECNSIETTPKKKKVEKKSKSPGGKSGKSQSKSKTKKSSVNGKQLHSKLEQVKDVYAYDSGSNASSSKSRGPFIHIRGPRDSPLSVSVVNAPLTDEDMEKKLNKHKKFHDDSEYRHKVRSRGLHCSTLSNKYDAQTRDASWICAFCKRGPHTTELKGSAASSATLEQTTPAGDLFGPYVITNQSPEFERRYDDPYDLQFKSKKVKRNIEASQGGNIKITGKKSKRKHSESYDSRLSLDSLDSSEIYLGITDMGNQTYEVWAHENCIVWSQGVYLIGPKIVGLEEAVWTTCNLPCQKCHLKGANICCLKRGCPNVMHFPCAQMSDWQLENDTFKVYCFEHKTK